MRQIDMGAQPRWNDVESGILEVGFVIGTHKEKCPDNLGYTVEPTTQG
jgi:hypothetical protein